MKAPADFVPSFSVWVSETDQKPIIGFCVSQAAAVDLATRYGLRKYIVRRSFWTVMGERPRGQVVYSVR